MYERYFKDIYDQRRSVYVYILLKKPEFHTHKLEHKGLCSILSLLLKDGYLAYTTNGASWQKST